MNAPSRTCPCCGSPVSRPFLSTAYLQCDRCQALLSTVPEASYETNYYYHDAEFETKESRRGKVLWRYFARILGLISRDTRVPVGEARLFELGCSRGYFIEECLSRGIKARGADISGQAIASAQARGLGDVCARADVLAPGAVAQIGASDIVVAWELLEHFDEPAAFLSTVRDLLPPGGWFVGSTPNGGSSWLRLLGAGWHGCGIPQYHRIYYNPSALDLTLSHSGFDAVRATTCVDWRDAFLIKNTATAMTRSMLGTNRMAVRGAVAAAIAIPEKLSEVLSGRVPGIDGDTLLFAARRAPAAA